MDVIELLWGEPAGPRRGPRPTLTVGDLARAGIELADAEGLAAVTMQRVAEALGVTKMATYRYVPGKDELVALMVDTALGAPPPLDDLDGWRPKLRAWSLAMNERMQAHPWSVRATAGPRVTGPNELTWAEVALAAVDGLALDGGQKMDVIVALTSQVRSLVEQTADNSEERISATWMTILDGRGERFPHVVAALASSARHSSRDQGLTFGLDRILDGVELYLSRQ
ncbi:TetR/AcrR family transcriptional regulator [Kutzneria buriramensis]|uniref:Regulatory TetR family protein n=1 Tax=Kutzneria buriramensis TaxID=1045776 RepID=A0A3E0HFA5_9PSEU|nr:TetR/AcrR family transcriptional regulator C-terminal domain-containing protein [Kutzneria buriramensis]REH43890.1 regulatory TetR family protein [Kutzneria buriramensis]